MKYTLFLFFAISFSFLIISSFAPAPLAFIFLAGGCGLALASSLAYSIMSPIGQVSILPLYVWLDLPGYVSTFGFFLDAASCLVTTLILFITLAVLFFARDYMGHDPAFVRFLSYISLFSCSMVLMVLSIDLVQFFFGWELIGLFSYLLVGFWSSRPSANRSALKAVFLNRAGDFSLFLLITLCIINFGTTSFPALLLLIPFVADSPSLSFFPYLILIAAAAKSAQYFFQDWLPDAMEGPTPVSSLLHSATMVTAGVFLLIRFSQVFSAFPTFQIFLGSIGTATALFGGLFAFSQFDLKRIVAYSTTANLGLMILACGLGFEFVALYHLINHALFKAFLFICSGLLIHATGGRQDLRSATAGFNTFPNLFGLFFFGLICSAGFPSTPSFYSKDMLIALFLSNSFPISFILAFYLTAGVGLFSFLYSLRPLFFIFSTPPATALAFHRIPYLGLLSLFMLLLAVLIVPDSVEAVFDPTLSGVPVGGEWSNLFSFQSDWPLVELSIPAFFLFFLFFILFFGARFFLSFPSPRFFSRAYQASLATPLRLFGIAKSSLPLSFQIFFNLDRVLLESVGPLGFHNLVSKFNPFWFSFDQVFLFLFSTILVALWFDPRVCVWVWFFLLDFAFDETQETERRSIEDITVDCKSVNGGSNPPAPYSLVKSFTVYKFFLGSRRGGFYVTFPDISDSLNIQTTPVSTYSALASGLDSNTLDQDLIGRTTFSVVNGPSIGPSRQDVIQFLSAGSDSKNRPISILLSTPFGTSSPAYPSSSGSWFFPAQRIFRSPLVTRWLFRPFVTGSLSGLPACSNFIKFSFRLRFPPRPFLGGVRFEFPFLGSLRCAAGRYVSSIFSSNLPLAPTVTNPALSLPRLLPLFQQISQFRQPVASKFSLAVSFYFNAEARFGLIRSFGIVPFFHMVSQNQTHLSSLVPYPRKPMYFSSIRRDFSVSSSIRLRTRFFVAPSTVGFPFFSFLQISRFISFFQFGVLASGLCYPAIFFPPRFDFYRHSLPGSEFHKAWKLHRSRTSLFTGSGLLQPKFKLVSKNSLNFSSLSPSKRAFSNFFDRRFIRFPALFIRGVFNRTLGFILSIVELFFDHVLHFYRPAAITTSYLFLPISHPPLDNPASAAKPSFSEEVYLHPPQDGWTLASPAEEIFPVSLSDLVRFPGVENYLPGPQVKNVLPRALGELQPILPLRTSPNYYRHGNFESSLPGIENEVSWGWDYELGSPLLLWHSFVPDPRHYTFVLNRIGFTPIWALIKCYSVLVYVCLLPTLGLPSNYRTKWFSVPTSFIWGRRNFLRLHRLQAILVERAAAKAEFQTYFLSSLSELEANTFLRLRLSLDYLGSGFAHRAKGIGGLFKTQISLARGEFAYPPSSVEPSKLSKLGFLSQTYQLGQTYQRRIWHRRLNGKLLASIHMFDHPSPIDSFSRKSPILASPQFWSHKGYNLPFSLWGSSSSNRVLNSLSNPTLAFRPTIPVSEVGFEPFFPPPLLPDFDPIFVPRVGFVGCMNLSPFSLGTRFSRLGSSLLFANWVDKPYGVGPQANTLFFDRLASQDLDGSFFRPEKSVRYAKEVPQQYKARAGLLRSFLWQKNQIAFLQSGWFTYLTHQVKTPGRTYFRRPQSLPSGNLPALPELDPGLDWHTPRSNFLPKKPPRFDSFSFFPNPVSVPVQYFLPRISFQAIIETLLSYPIEYHWPPRGRTDRSWLDFPKPTEELPEKSLTVGRKKKPSAKEAEEVEKPKETLQQILDRFRFEVPNAEKDMDQSEKEARLEELSEQLPVFRFKDLVALDYPRDVAEHEEQRLLLLKTALRLKPILRGRFWFWRYFRLYEFIAGRFNPYDIHADYRYNTGLSYTFLYTLFHGGLARPLTFPHRLWNTLRYDLSLYLTMYTLFPIEDRPSEFQPTIDYSTGHVEPAVEEEPNPISSPIKFLDFLYRFGTQDLLPRLSDLTPWVHSAQHFFAVQIPGFFMLSLGYFFDLIPNILSIATNQFSLNFQFGFKKLTWIRPFHFQFLRPLGKFLGLILPQPFFSQFASKTVFIRNLKEFFFDLFGLRSFPLIRSLLSLMFLQIADFLLRPRFRFSFVLLVGGLLVSLFGALLVSIGLTAFAIPGSLLLPLIDPDLLGFHYLLAGVNSSFARFLSLETFLLNEYFGFLFSAAIDAGKHVTGLPLPFQFLSPILVSPVFAALVLVSQLLFFYCAIFSLLRLTVCLSDLATSILSKFFQILSLLVRPTSFSFPGLNSFFLNGLPLEITPFSPFLAFSGLVNYSKNWSRFLTFTAGLLGHSLALPSFVRHAGSTFVYPRSSFSTNSPLDPNPSASTLLLRLPSPDQVSDFFTGVVSTPVQAKPKFSSFRFPYTFSFLVKASWQLSSIYAGEHFPALTKKEWHMRPWIYWLRNRTRQRPQGIWLVPITSSTPIRHRPASYITWQYLAHIGYTWAGISKQFPFKSLSPLHLRWTAPTGLDLWIRFLRRIFVPRIHKAPLSTVQGLRYLQSVADSLFRFLEPSRGLTIDLRSFDWIGLALQSIANSSRFRFDQRLRIRFTASFHKIFSNGNCLSHYSYRLPFDRPNLLSSYFPSFRIPDLLRNPPAPQWDFESPNSVPSFFNTVLETLSSPQTRVEKFSSISEGKLLELRFRPWPVDPFFYNPPQELYFCRPRLYEFLVRYQLDPRSKLYRLLRRRRRARFTTPLGRKSFEELASIFTGVKHGVTPSSGSKPKKKNTDSVSYLDLIRRKKGMEPLDQAQARYEAEHQFRRKPDETHEDGVPLDKNAFRRAPEPKKKKPTLEFFSLLASQFKSIPSAFGRFAANALPFPLAAKFRRRRLFNFASNLTSSPTHTTVDHYLQQLNRSPNASWLLVQAFFEAIFWIFRGLISFLILFFLPLAVIPSFLFQSVFFPFFAPFFISAGTKVRAWVFRSLRLPYVVFSWFYFQLSDWWDMLSNVGIENPEKWNETPYLYQWITNMGYAAPLGEETDDIVYQHFAERDYSFFLAVRRFRLEVRLFWAKLVLNFLKWRLKLDRWLFPASYHSYLVRSTSLRQLQYDQFIARYLAALWSSSRIPNSRRSRGCRPFYRDLFMTGPELSALTFRIPAFSRPVSFAYEFSRFFRLARAYRLVFLFGRISSEELSPVTYDELGLVAYQFSNTVFGSNLRPFFNSKTRFLPYLARYRQIIRFRDVFKLSLGKAFQQFPRLKPVPYLIERTYEKLHRSAGEAAFVIDTATTTEIVPFGLSFDRPKSRYLLFNWIAFDWSVWARNLWIVILPPILLLAGLFLFISNWSSLPPYLQFLLTSIPPQFFKSHTLALIWIAVFLLPLIPVHFLLRIRPFGVSPVQFHTRLDRQISLFRFSRVSGSAHLADESVYLSYPANNPPEIEEDIPFGPFEFYTFDEELVDVYKELPNFIYSFSLAPKDSRESLLPPELPYLYQSDLMQRVRGLGRFVEVFFDPNFPKIRIYNEYLYALQSLPKWAQWYYMQVAGLPLNPLSAETQESMRLLSDEFVYNNRSLVSSSVLKTFPTPEHKSHLVDWVFSPDKFNWRARTLLTSYGTVLRYMNFDPEDEDEGNYDENAPFSEIRFAGPSWFQLSMAGRLSQYVDDPAFKTVYKAEKNSPDEEFAHMIDVTADPNLQYYSPFNHEEDDADANSANYDAPANILDEEKNAEMLTEIGFALGIVYYHFLVPRFTFPITGQNPFSHQTVSRFYDRSEPISPSFINATYSTSPRPPTTVRWSDSYLQNPNFDPEFDKYHISPRLRRHDHSVVPYLPPHADWLEPIMHAPWFLYPWPDQRPQPGYHGRRRSSLIAAQPRIKTTHAFSILDTKLFGRRPVLLKGLQPSYSYSYTVIGNKSDFPRRPKLGDLNRYKVDLHDSSSLFYFDSTFRPFREDLSDSEFEVYQGSITSFAETPNQVPSGAGPYLFKAKDTSSIPTRDRRQVSGHRFRLSDPRTTWPRELQTEFRGLDPLLDWGIRGLEFEFDYSAASSSYPGFDFLNSPVPLPDFPIDPETKQEEVPASYFPYFFTEAEDDDWSDDLDTSFEDEDSDPVNNGWYRSWTPDPAFSVRNPSPEERLQILSHLGDYFQAFDGALQSNRRVDWLRVDEFRRFLRIKFRASEAPYAQLVGPDDFQFDLDSSSSDFFYTPDAMLGAYDGDLFRLGNHAEVEYSGFSPDRDSSLITTTNLVDDHVPIDVIGQAKYDYANPAISPTYVEDEEDVLARGYPNRFWVELEELEDSGFNDIFEPITAPFEYPNEDRYVDSVVQNTMMSDKYESGPYFPFDSYEDTQPELVRISTFRPLWPVTTQARQLSTPWVMERHWQAREKKRWLYALTNPYPHPQRDTISIWSLPTPKFPRAQLRRKDRLLDQWKKGRWNGPFGEQFDYFFPEPEFQKLKPKFISYFSKHPNVWSDLQIGKMAQRSPRYWMARTLIPGYHYSEIGFRDPRRDLSINGPVLDLFTDRRELQRHLELYYLRLLHFCRVSGVLYEHPSTSVHPQSDRLAAIRSFARYTRTSPKEKLRYKGKLYSYPDSVDHAGGVDSIPQHQLAFGRAHAPYKGAGMGDLDIRRIPRWNWQPLTPLEHILNWLHKTSLFVLFFVTARVFPALRQLFDLFFSSVLDPLLIVSPSFLGPTILIFFLVLKVFELAYLSMFNWFLEFPLWIQFRTSQIFFEEMRPGGSSSCFKVHPRFYRYKAHTDRDAKIKFQKYPEDFFF